MRFLESKMTMQLMCSCVYIVMMLFLSETVSAFRGDLWTGTGALMKWTTGKKTSSHMGNLHFDMSSRHPLSTTRDHIFPHSVLHVYDRKGSYRLHATTTPLSSVPTATSSPSPSSTMQDEPMKKPYSFVQDDLRPYAMKLHTRDQAPKEGQQKAQVPFTKWQPSRTNYLQFLVDSLHVYEAFEDICEHHAVLAPFRHTGLERANALREDIAWMLTYDASLSPLNLSEGAIQYANFLKDIVQQSVPKFMCHYYNHYFAHTAGGRMIGAKMSELLLENKVLKFYQWDGDVKVMLDDTKRKIDQLANTWSEHEKIECMEETMATFKYGGLLMTSLKPPQ